jgi:glycosyltransferase family protein
MHLLFYGKLFHYPRQLLKRLTSGLYPLIIKIWPLPKVYTIEETLQFIIRNKASIARFGDSEMLYITDRRDLPYQKYDSRLSAILKEILKFDRSYLLVGLPEAYRSLGNCAKVHQRFGRSQIVWTYPRLHRYLDTTKTYFNANITRFYYGFGDIELSKKLFGLVKGIWENRKILLIEGEKSRLGMGNDLFSNALQVERILGPAHHAFTKFDELLEESSKHDKDKLVLVAMGPTAKALVYFLAARGYQAIDIGNLDLEYEWFRMGVTERVKVKGKYTSEVAGGRVVEDVDDPIYHSQIIARFA